MNKAPPLKNRQGSRIWLHGVGAWAVIKLDCVLIELQYSHHTYAQGQLTGESDVTLSTVFQTLLEAAATIC